MDNKTISLPIKKYSIVQNDDNFLYVRLQVIKEGLNLNGSDFLLEGMQKSKDSFHQKPLLCAFPKNYMTGEYKLGDGHTSEEKYDSDEDILYYSYLDASSERCIGFVPNESNISIENINGENWIVLDALIWKIYNYELCKELLKKRNRGMTNKISVEISLIDFYEANSIEYIKEFIGDGITILATDDSVKEGIPGANLRVYSSSEKYSKFQHALNFALNNDKGSDKKVFEQLSMNQLCDTVRAILDKYTFMDGDWERNKYWIDDIKDKVIIVHNCEDGKLYEIPYSIDEQNNVTLDIENKVEVLIDYKPKNNFSEKILFISKDKLGTKSSIKIDKSKDSLSDSSWGDVDKSKLKKDCFMASNWESVCEAVFMQLLDGWKDGKEGSLKYPVMQKIGDKVVYNRYGLASAKAYAEKNDESKVLSKINAIYKKLGLDNTKKEENMKKFIEKAKKNGFSFLGISNNNLVFSKEKEFEDEKDKDKEEMKKMSVYEIPYDNIKFEEDEKFKAEDFKEKDLKMAEDDDGDEDDKREFEKLKEKYDKMEKLCHTYEDEKKQFEDDKKAFDELKNKFEEDKKAFEDEKSKYEDEKKTMKAETLKKETEEIMEDKDFGLDEKDIMELRKMRDEGKFEDVKKFVQEVGYRKEIKRMTTKNLTSSLSFNLNLNSKPNDSNKSDIDKLLETLK